MRGWSLKVFNGRKYYHRTKESLEQLEKDMQGNLIEDAPREEHQRTHLSDVTRSYLKCMTRSTPFMNKIKKEMV